MVDKVTVTAMAAHTKEYIQHITSESDGTGESAVTKLDMSTLTGVTALTVMQIEFIVSGMNYVTLAWDATTDDVIAVLSGSGIIDFSESNGKVDPQSSGTTGDIKLTTDGHVDGSMYDILITYKLVT